ncbi:MAG TPA: DUF3486 family protein [Candidatus Treponema faecavium]|nr:DUF3486 family protein [Candidatus Treponema faecavium]
MPRRNKIELQGLVDRIVDMFYRDKMTQAEIAQQLKEEGYDVSKSGVGRALLDYAGQMKAYKEAAAEAAAIVKELRGESGLDLAETTSQLLQVKLLSAVKSVDTAELDDMELKDLFSAVRKNTQSQVQIARVKLEFERGYRKGLFKAAQVIEEEARKAGVSKNTITVIRRKVLELKVPSSEER